MAAGVGKTYRMLQEGQAEAEAGRDVVIGYLEAHGRPETDALRRSASRSFRAAASPTARETIEEMDVGAVVARAPELAPDRRARPLERARPRAREALRGRRGGARGRDRRLLDRQRPAPREPQRQVAELTGTRVREIVPDAVLAEADEIVLDRPDRRGAVERLRAGKVYPEERIESALQNFFRIENLQSLRELALRQVAEEVESKRFVDGSCTRTARADGRVHRHRRAAGDRRTAARAGQAPRRPPSGSIRRSWRSAQRLGTELDLLWVRVEQRAAERRGRRAARGDAASRRRCSAPTCWSRRETTGRDASSGSPRARHHLRAARPARPRRSLLGRLREPLPLRLLEALPGHRRPDRRRPDAASSRSAEPPT